MTRITYITYFFFLITITLLILKITVTHSIFILGGQGVHTVDNFQKISHPLILHNLLRIRYNCEENFRYHSGTFDSEFVCKILPKMVNGEKSINNIAMQEFWFQWEL